MDQAGVADTPVGTECEIRGPVPLKDNRRLITMATPRKEERTGITKETVFDNSPVLNMMLHIFRSTILHTYLESRSTGIHSFIQ